MKTLTTFFLALVSAYVMLAAASAQADGNGYNQYRRAVLGDAGVAPTDQFRAAQIAAKKSADVMAE